MKNNATNEDYIVESYRSMNCKQRARLISYIALLQSQDLAELFSIDEKNGLDSDKLAS